MQEGKIKAVGEGEPPEELRYPELLLNGRGRLLAPGMSGGLIFITPYPFRYGKLSEVPWEGIKDFLESITRTDIYYLAGMVFTDMLLRGVTSVLVSDIYLDNVARAAVDSGIYVTLAPPFNCGLRDFSPENELRLLLSRWHGKVDNVRAAVFVCGSPSEEVVDIARQNSLSLYVFNPPEPVSAEDVNVVYINPHFQPVKGSAITSSSQISEWVPEYGLGLGVRPSMSTADLLKEVSQFTKSHPLDALHSAVEITPSLIGYGNLSPLDVGVTANVVMFNTAEPPGWPPPTGLEEAVKAVVQGDLRVESVILGENVVVDGGESLLIGYDFIRKARDRLEPLIEEFLSRA